MFICNLWLKFKGSGYSCLFVYFVVSFQCHKSKVRGRKVPGYYPSTFLSSRFERGLEFHVDQVRVPFLFGSRGAAPGWQMAPLLGSKIGARICGGGFSGSLVGKSSGELAPEFT